MARCMVAALAALVSFAAAPLPAGADVASAPFRLAQITIQLGVPDELVFRSLHGLGYYDIDIVSRTLSRSRAQACLDGVRYQMEIGVAGDIRKREQIGQCPRPITLRQAHEILAKEGFRDVDIEERPDGFTAIACRQNDRFRIAIDRFGTVTERQPQGRCRSVHSPDEIVVLVRSLGYTRVRVVDPRPPRYVVEACRENDRVEIVMFADGAIGPSRRIGRCEPPIDPRAIPRLLADRGFSRVEIVDPRPPRYVARACRGDERIELVLDRFGELVEQRPVGRCAPPLTRQQIVDRLGDLGYSRVRITHQGGGEYVAEVCDKAEHLRVRISIHGDTLDEQRIGRCAAPGLDEVLRQFEGQGVSGATLFVEGCRRGSRVRIELDAFGEVVDTVVGGRCR